MRHYRSYFIYPSICLLLAAIPTSPSTAADPVTAPSQYIPLPSGDEEKRPLGTPRPPVIQLEELGRYIEPITGDSRRQLAIAVSGDLLVFAARDEGLKIFTIGNPASPSLITTWDPGAQVVDVELAGDFAVIELEAVGTQIIDISDPATPTMTSQIPVVGKIHVVEDRIFIAATGTDNGLHIFDIGEAGIAQEIGSYLIRDSHEVNSVAASGDHIFISAGTGGIYVLDASNPSDLSLVTQLSVFSVSPPGRIDLTVSGRFLFAFIDDYFDYQAVDTIDMSDPESPVTLTRLKELCCDVGMDGNIAFFAASAGVGLNAINLDYPADPISVGGFSTSTENLTMFAGSIAVAGDKVFVAIDSKTGTDTPGGFAILQRKPLEETNFEVTGHQAETGTELKVRYPSGNLYWIERSSDLSGWNPLTPWRDVAAWVLSGTGQNQEVIDKSAAARSADHFFYRLSPGSRIIHDGAFREE